MTPLEDKLRAALRETAGEIPADPPPLRLATRVRSPRPGQRRWIAWAVPLAAAAVVVAVVAGSLAVTGGWPGPRATTASASLAGVPPYYVALTSGKAHPDINASDSTTAEVRVTATGAVLARFVVPKPYIGFSGVTAAADDRTFVLVAEAKNNPPASAQQYAREYPHGYYPASRFYLLHIDSVVTTLKDQKTSARASLRALPAAFIPANDEVHAMALAPDGTSLAADIGTPLFRSQLFVFNLATGAKRAWSFTTCGGCGPSSGGLGFGGLNADALSWTADGKQIAFVGPGASRHAPTAVRLLNTDAPGSDLLANSKPVAGWPGGPSLAIGSTWRGAIVTPDGRTVVAVLELATNPPGGGVNVGEQLVKFSTATGQVTATLNNLNVLRMDGYEQILYTTPSGNVLVVSYARPGMSAGILHGDRYTPIPWSPHIATAAW